MFCWFVIIFYIYLCTLNKTKFRNRYEHASKLGSLVFLEAGASVLGNPVLGLLDGGGSCCSGGCIGGWTGGCHDALEDIGGFYWGLSVVLLHRVPNHAYVYKHHPILHFRGLAACGLCERHRDGVQFLGAMGLDSGGVCSDAGLYGLAHRDNSGYGDDVADACDGEICL